VVRPLGRVVAQAIARLGEVYRVAVTKGRWAVLATWIVAAVGVSVFVPTSHQASNDFGELLPPNSSVIEVQERILEKFRVPLVSGTTVVVHQPGGLSLLTRADSVLWALATTQRSLEAPEPPGPGQIVAAIPVPTGRSDTTVTYLYASEGTGVWHTVQLAKQYAAHFQNQPEVEAYVTGSIPAQIAQGSYLDARLPVFEVASVLLILLVVALAFRSLLAPFVVLGIAAVGYLVYFPLLANLAAAFGFSVPTQLEPVLLALLLGVVTDYCVLLFAALRVEVDHHPDPFEATRRALKSDALIIAVAGLTVAGGTLALLAAPFAIFRGLAPALALTVLVGLAVCLTLTPALMAILSWRLFTVLPVRGSHRREHLIELHHLGTTATTKPRHQPGWAIRYLVRRGPALLATVGVVLVLGVASIPLGHTKLSLSFTAGLPESDSVARGAQVLDSAGLRGISAPTEVLVEQDGIAAQRVRLAELQRLIASQPGVVKVYGPADLPLDDAQGVVLAPGGDAARFMVVFATDPLAAEAVDSALRLQARLPALARQAGLPNAQVSATGQTFIAAEVAQLTRISLQVTVVVALLIELVILTIFLRAIVASIVLLICSALSVTAALGLTTWLFQDVLGQEGLTFYAPFAAAVLLIALGSDYNVFAVGAIWEEAGRRPLADAMLHAVPRTSHAITTAGAILAATFALVAIIPLSTFRQIAFAMTVGILLDTLIIRPILTPAVLTLLGRFAGWPSRRIRTSGDVSPEPVSAGEPSPKVLTS
jgi:putative drug exporter of the RND superfamily